MDVRLVLAAQLAARNVLLANIETRRPAAVNPSQ
jgi:hypothetical protein